MDEHERKELDEKTQIILEKHKGKVRLYPKMKKAFYEFSDYPYVDPKIYRELAKLTAKINYRCNFKDGKCKKGRSNMCCCYNCGMYFGHFDMRFFNKYSSKEYIEEEILYYVKKFNKKTGFWRKDKGCILPRERRSAVCLCYNCSSDRLTTEEKLLLDIIRNCRRTKFPDYTHRIINILKDYFLYRE